MASPKKRRRYYPGQGAPWADFLHHRARVLLEWEREGLSPEQMVSRIAMDPGQVRLILAHAHDTTQKGTR